MIKIEFTPEQEAQILAVANIGQAPKGPVQSKQIVKEKIAIKPEPSGNIELPDATPSLDSSLLLRCLDNELDRRTQLAGNNVAAETGEFPHAFRHRPMVFVAKVEDGNYTEVKTIDQLRDLFSSVTEIEEEDSYNGYDYKDVTVLRCTMPEGYVARVPYIRLKHMPSRYMCMDAVLAKRMAPRGNMPIETVILCRNLAPVWTDRNLFEVREDVIRKNYNFITVKIRKEDYTLKAWFPGVDIKTGICSSLSDEFVRIGRHHENKRQPNPEEKNRWDYGY